MQFIPVIQRELAVLARRKATFWARVGSAGLALVVFFAILLFDQRPPSRLGPALLYILSIFIFLECILAGLSYTCDCLSEERREGTLGLLFLTPLKGLDIVLGKLVSRSLSSVYNLLAVIPIFALCLLLGGVQGGQVLALSFAFLLTTAFSLAAGICVSSRGIHERTVLFQTLLLIALFTLLPPVLFRGLEYAFGYRAAFEPLLWLSPAYAFREAGRGVGPQFLWSSWTILAVSLLMVAKAAWHLRPSAALYEPAPAIAPAKWVPRIARPGQERFLKINPMLWLALQDSTRRRVVWSLAALALGFGCFSRLALENNANTLIPFIVFGCYGIHAFYKLALVAEASRRLSEDKHSGALELLLSTPLPPRFILQGQIRAARHTWLPLGLGVALMNLIWMTHDEFLDEMWIFLPVSLFLLWIDQHALIWLALRNSLQPWRYSRVVLQTWLRVLALPILLLVLTFLAAAPRGMSQEEGSAITFFWAIACTIYDVVLIRGSIRTLQNFRSLAAGENPRRSFMPGAPKPAGQALRASATIPA